MNDLTIPLTESEKMFLGNELEKLFVFQDRPISKDKKALLVEELALSGIPFDALIQGIKKLEHEDLRSIKLATIKDASRDFFAHDETKLKCENCCRGGYVPVIDDKHRYFSRSCLCDIGKRRKQTDRLVDVSAAF